MKNDLIIRQAPIEPKARKWITITPYTGGYFIYRCSVCGKFSLEDYAFCPNCGKQMKGVDDE